MNESKMFLDVNEKPTIGKWIILAIQHVFAMFGATILVPILVNSAAGETVLTIPVALVTSGIGTLIYILCTKGKSPVYLGSSFAFITPIAAAFLKGGTSGAMTGIMAVGLIYVIVATIIHFTGKGWLDKLLPPVVIGPMIMIIGLGLAPSAISQIGLSSGTPFEWKGVLVAAVSFLVTAIVMTKAKGFLKIIPFLVGIVSGYVLSICLGLVDFTQVAQAGFFSMPNFVLPFKDYALNFGPVLTIAPIALVTMAEHIGDHTALSTIINKDLLKNPGLDKTLLGDGIATFVATNSDITLGISLAIAIAMHNIPEGISISVPIYYSTNNKKKALLYTGVSALSEPFGAFLAYIFLKNIMNDLILGILFSLIAGIMLQISFCELLPTARRYNNTKYLIIFFLIGVLFMLMKFIL